MTVIKRKAERPNPNPQALQLQMLTAKRPLSELSLPPKRARGISEGRLCDLRNSLSLFTNANNATRARERGILRSRDASSKYEEVRTHASRPFAAPNSRP